jgi:hypothetical protein
MRVYVCVVACVFNPFTAEVAIMQLLGSAPVAFVRPEKKEQSDWLV